MLLALGGYPWTVIRVDARTEYLTVLDLASIENDVHPFAEFIAGQVRWSMGSRKP